MNRELIKRWHIAFVTVVAFVSALMGLVSPLGWVGAIIVACLWLAAGIYAFFPKIQRLRQRVRRRRGQIPYLFIGRLTEDECVSDQGNKQEVLQGVAFAALLLLLMEQLENGMWSKTHILRKDGHAEGTLSSTYFILENLRLLLNGDNDSVIDLGCLNRLPNHMKEEARSNQGVYQRTHRTITDIPKDEEPHHMAAALGIRLSLGKPDSNDSRTLEWLCKNCDQFSAEPWGASFTARTLLMWLHLCSDYENGKALSRKVDETYDRLTQALADQGTRTLSDPRTLWEPKRKNRAMSFGNPIYQWSVVWALLPTLQDTKFTCVKTAEQIAQCILGYAGEHTTAQPDQSKRFLDRWGTVPQTPERLSTFGTCIGLMGVSVIERSFPALRNEAQRLRDNIASRVMQEELNSIVDLPIGVDVDEGYNAWTPLLASLMLLGAQLGSKDLSCANMLAKHWRSVPTEVITVEGITEAFRCSLSEAGIKDELGEAASVIEQVLPIAACREARYREFRSRQMNRAT